MIGPEGAAVALTTELADRLPAALAALRDRYTDPGGVPVPVDLLPDPAVVEPHDRIRRPLEDYPAVLVLVLELRRLTPADRPDDAGEVYVGRYLTRTYLWCRGDDETDTDLQRKRYVLATRESLLARRTLAQLVQGDSGLWLPAGDVPTVDPVTIREDYSPLVLDENGATVAAAYVEADILIAEDLGPAAPVAAATTVHVDETPLTPHPAL